MNDQGAYDDSSFLTFPLYSYNKALPVMPSVVSSVYCALWPAVIHICVRFIGSQVYKSQSQVYSHRVLHHPQKKKGGARSESQELSVLLDLS